MNASSTIFQISAVVRVSTMMCGFLLLRNLRPSTPMLRQSNETVFRSASGHGLSPHIMPNSVGLWHLSLQFISYWPFWALLSRFECAEEPMIVSSHIDSCGSSTSSGLGPRCVSKMIFSLYSKANLYCTLHFSHQSHGSCVGFVPKSIDLKGSLFNWQRRFVIHCFVVASAAQRHNYQIIVGPR